MIERHWDGIAAYCRAENKVSLGFVGGLNNKIRVIQRLLRPQKRGILPPQSPHLHVAGTIAAPGGSVPRHARSCRRARNRQGRFAPLKRWPEGGPSLTAAARVDISRVQVGTEGWCRSNRRTGPKKTEP